MTARRLWASRPPATVPESSATTSGRVIAVRRRQEPRRPAPVPCTRLAFAAVVVVTSLVAGCGGDDGEQGAAPGDGTLELAPSTSTTAPPATAALLDALPEEPPLPGFVPADDVLGAGPLDLEAAAAGEEDADAERAVLEQRRFVGGASRAWLGPEEAVAYVAVYAFASPADAEAYLAETRERLGARGAERFDVPGIDGAVGSTTVESGEDGSFTASAVTFTRGDRWVLTLLGSPAAAPTVEDAVTVARAQADRLG